jgi:metallo-beta-lactamase class B
MNRQPAYLVIFALLFCYFNVTNAQQLMLTDPSSFSPEADDPTRTVRIEPLNLIDNIYSVSAVSHYPSYLITTSEGHIIIDTSLAELAPDIANNVKKLGFNLEDIKYLLTLHAHTDHVGGHAYMKEMTGATVMAMSDDAHVMESGGVTDFRDGGTWPSVKVDRIIHDLEKIQLGDTVLTAHLTPGHSKGCTTWTMVAEESGKKYNVVFYCGTRMNPAEALVGNPEYPNMPEDLAYAFAKLKALPVDVFFAGHGYWFNFQDKIEMRKKGHTPNPFIDPVSYRWIVDGSERAFIERLRIERGLIED